jgi:3-hydroxyacyl-[acyl-carrier-protein] dehydratase
MIRESESAVPAMHPAMPGHFPDNPVVPAVVILEGVRNALTAWQEASSIATILHVKFVAVLRPEERFKITLSSDDLRRFSFDCRKDSGVRFAYGEFLAGPSDDAR